MSAISLRKISKAEFHIKFIRFVNVIFIKLYTHWILSNSWTSNFFLKKNTKIGNCHYSKFCVILDPLFSFSISVSEIGKATPIFVYVITYPHPQPTLPLHYPHPTLPHPTPTLPENGVLGIYSMFEQHDREREIIQCYITWRFVANSHGSTVRLTTEFKVLFTTPSCTVGIFVYRINICMCVYVCMHIRTHTHVHMHTHNGEKFEIWSL